MIVVSEEYLQSLENLADTVRACIQGGPESPWIPGAAIGPLMRAVRQYEDYEDERER